MKRFFIVFLSLIASGLGLRAQYVNLDMLRKQTVPVTLKVLDSLSREPVAFASVYLNHPSDSVITHFTLTDPEGKAMLEEVPIGEHQLSIELLGYKPYKKVFFLKDRKDFGTILLSEDPRMLEAARISAIGTPVEYRQDTVIFNASSFHAGEADVLKDLLKKMPTVEVDSKGNVKVGGKEVSKITVNGKTFFMGEKQAALDNLPAKAVDKVKVIDKESDAAAFTGIKDDTKETVMDVELKQEYKHGVFGNVRGAGGTSIPSEEQEDLLVNRPFLWNGNAMVSAFGEKDQVTFIGNGMNVSGEDGVIVYSGGSYMGEGIPTSAQAGINYNTDRLKGMSTNATTYYRFNGMDSHSRSSTTTFGSDEGDLISFEDRMSHSGRHYLHAGAEFEKQDQSKYTFIFKPRIAVSQTQTALSDSTSSTVGDDLRNISTGDETSAKRAFTTNGEFTFGVRDLGKEMRSLTLVGNYRIDADKGTEFESHNTRYSDGTTDDRTLNYNRGAGDKALYLSLQYVEPLSENWAIQAVAATDLNEDHSFKDAFNIDGSANNLYSASSESHYVSGLGRVLMQYNKDARNLRVGGLVRASQSVTDATSAGVSSSANSGLLWNFAPFVVWREQLSGGKYFNLRYDGVSDRPQHSNMLPVLNISNPTFLTMGNIHLKPSFDHSISASLRGNNPAKRQYWSVYLRGNMKLRPQVEALWLDSNSIRYSVPVNSRTPSGSFGLSANIGSGIGKDTPLSFALYSYSSFTRSVSYQPGGTGTKINIGDFDYNSFMDTFWGPDGENFYSGASGFAESLTRQLSSTLDASLNWDGETIEATLTAFADYRGAWYSLNNAANTNSLMLGLSTNFSWRLPREYTLKGYIGRSSFFGYAPGFDRPRTPASLSVEKDIKAWTFKLSLNDIFDQGLMNNHSVGANYVTDRYSAAIGRYVMLSATYRFGKMNADRSATAQGAMWKMF